MGTIFDHEYKQRLQLHCEVLSPDWIDTIISFNQEQLNPAVNRIRGFLKWAHHFCWKFPNPFNFPGIDRRNL